MKFLICSDIHGSQSAAQKLVQFFEYSKADFILLLGDILYHGPRNNLPDEYNPRNVADLLNVYAGKIISCRGNCDAEVDQMLLKFPVLNPYSVVFYNGLKIFATHGHIYSPINGDGQIAVANAALPPITDYDLVLYGHTHIPVLYRTNNYAVCNPGSVSLPKSDNKCRFAILDNRIITTYDFDFNELESLAL